MKLPSIVLLLTVAAISCGFDYSISWAQPLPETIAPWTWVTPVIWLKTIVGGVPMTVTVSMNYDGRSVVSLPLRPPDPGDSVSVAFPAYMLGDGDSAYLLGFVLGPDSNPHNDTVYHRFWIYTPGIDVGIEWWPPLPDTVPQDTVMLPGVRATNYTDPPAQFYVVMGLYIGPGDSMVYQNFIHIPWLPGGTDTTLPLLTLNIGWLEMMLKCWLAIEGDTNPSNDTLWWRPYVRTGLEEQPRRAPTPSGLRVMPDPFMSSVTVAGPIDGIVTVRDVNGRALSRLRTDEDGHALWDGCDSRGLLVPRGVYFFESEASGLRLKTRAVKVR